MEEKLKTRKSRRKYKSLRSQESTTDGDGEQISTCDGGRRRIEGDVRCSVTQGKETEVWETKSTDEEGQWQGKKTGG